MQIDKIDTTLEKCLLHQIFNATIWCTFDVFYIQYMLPILLHDIHASGFIIGICLSSQTLGLAVSGPIIGRIIDNRSQIALVVLFGCVFKSISLAILYLGFCLQLTPLLITAMFCIGLTITAIRDSLRVIVADHTCFEHRSEYLGKLRQRGGIGALIGWTIGFAWFGLASNDIISWNIDAVQANTGTRWWFKTIVPFSIFTFGCIFSGYLLFKYIKIIQANSNPKTGKKIQNQNSTCTVVDIKSLDNQIDEHKSDIKDTNPSINKPECENTNIDKENKKIQSTMQNITTTSGIAGLLLLLGWERFVQSLIGPFAIVFLMEKMTNYSETVILLCYTPGGILAIIMCPLIGKILDKYVKILPRYILCIVSFMGAGITVAYIYCNTVVQVIFIVLGDFTVMTTAALALNKMISALSNQHRGTIFGLSTAIEQTCTLIGPIVGGILWDYMSHRTPFWASVFAESLIGLMYVAFFYAYPLDAMTFDGM
eukprot:408813_1